MRVLTVEGSREVDRLASEEYGIPSLILMENAAIGVADAICEIFPEVERVTIFCGPGNNGGDGLAVGRHLDRRGYAVSLVLVGERPLEGDAAVQERICRLQGLPLARWRHEKDLTLATLDWDLAVDALFGSGLSRALSGIYRDVVELLNGSPAPRVAIDLPSGLSGDSAQLLGPHVLADLTVTFEALKPAHVLPPACDAAGELVVTDLGVSATLAERAESDMTFTTLDLAGSWLPERARDAHKGTFGHVLVAAGSPGFAGAAVLAARGAILGGAGLVTCAVPESLLSTVDAASLESMTLGLPAGEHGGFNADSVEPLLAAAAERSVLALGPGIGSHAQTREAARRMVLEATVPVVLDASGLDAFAGDLGALRGRRAPTVLTPHPGELARLSDRDPRAVTDDRPSAVREAARSSGAVVVLKGRRSLTAAPDGHLFVNSTGNPGMGTGGTGDVLTGAIAAFLALGLEPVIGAALGVFVHGLAGDMAAEEGGEASLTASDLLGMLPAAMHEVESA